MSKISAKELTYNLNIPKVFTFLGLLFLVFHYLFSPKVTYEPVYFHGITNTVWSQSCSSYISSFFPNSFYFPLLGIFSGDFMLPLAVSPL